MKENPSLSIAAGKGCFTCCKGCYQYFGKTLISTDDLLNFVKKYKEAFNISKITVAGGDPMTRKDIIYLIDELCKMNLQIYLDTVGKNFVKPSDIYFQDNGIAKYVNPEILVNKITKIGIPLDGYTTEQINYFRTNINLEEILQILKVLNNSQYNICINTVVNKMNLNSLKNIANIIREYKNINKWQLFQYSPIGNLGYKNRNLYEISEDDFKVKILELINDIGDYPFEIEGKSNSYRKLNYILVNSDGDVWQPSYSVTSSKFIESDCNDQKVIIGNIIDDDIIEKIKIHLSKINNEIFFIEPSKILKK